jgi:CubicO group peptidase (beta-lactamase class C family)
MPRACRRSTPPSEAIAAHKLPGAVFHLERDGAVYEQAYGASATSRMRGGRARATVFDAASLSKVLATAPSVLMLAEEGKLDLDARWPITSRNARTAARRPSRSATC